MELKCYRLMCFDPLKKHGGRGRFGNKMICLMRMHYNIKVPVVWTYVRKRIRAKFAMSHSRKKITQFLMVSILKKELGFK